MAGRTPEEALDHYVERLRLTLSCVANAVAFGSGVALGELHALTFYVPGQVEPNRVRMRTIDGSDELLLQVVERYSLVFQPDVVQRAPYDVWTSYYQYRILDRAGAEIVVYHWEPQGRSPVVKPHLHVPSARPIDLPGSGGEGRRKLYLNRLHLPTRRVGIEDIVELLLTDFGVVPNRVDWKETLAIATSAGGR